MCNRFMVLCLHHVKLGFSYYPRFNSCTFTYNDWNLYLRKLKKSFKRKAYSTTLQGNQINCMALSGNFMLAFIQP